jgi:hypothetical protein
MQRILQKPSLADFASRISLSSSELKPFPAYAEVKKHNHTIVAHVI